MKKALIAMSGGVDSSVAAKLMLDAGYDCMGATMKLFDSDDILMAQRERPAAPCPMWRTPAAWPADWVCPIKCSILKVTLRKKSLINLLPPMRQAAPPTPALTATSA